MSIYWTPICEEPLVAPQPPDDAVEPRSPVRILRNQNFDSRNYFFNKKKKLFFGQLFFWPTRRFFDHCVPTDFFLQTAQLGKKSVSVGIWIFDRKTRPLEKWITTKKRWWCNFCLRGQPQHHRRRSRVRGLRTCKFRVVDNHVSSCCKSFFCQVYAF